MIRHLWRALVAHFMEPRCVYCGAQQDRAAGACVTPTVVSMTHLFPDGTGALQTSNFTAQELADLPDWDD